MKKLRIGFDAKRIFHNATGLGNYSRTLVNNLVSRYPDHDYHLFTPTVSENIFAQPFLDSDRFTIHTSGAWPSSIWRSFRLGRLIDRLDLDLYHGLSHELPIGRAPSKAKTVVTFHDLIYEIYPDHFKQVDRKLYQTKYRRSAEVADHIISISKSTAADLGRLYGIDTSKVTVCYQSCNPAYLQDTRPYAKGSYLLYVGSIIKRKGLLQIAQAVEMLNPSDRLMVKVVGGGGAYQGAVQRFVKDHALEEWFEFVGPVDQAQLQDLYYQARALVLPSVYEGFGIPVIESLAVGTPVITSHVSSLPEAAGPGALLVDPTNPLVISEALRQIIQDEELAEQLGKAGKAYVRSTFGQQKTTEAVMDVYTELLRKSTKA